MSESPIWFVTQNNRFGYRALPVGLTGWLVTAGFVLALLAPIFLAIFVIVRIDNPVPIFIPLALNPLVLFAMVKVIRKHGMPFESYIELKARKS